MTSYIALIRKEADSDFGVDFPDLPGCVSAGHTLEEARRMAAEALFFHLEGMAEDHEPIPAPTGLDAVMTDPDNRDGVAVLVDVPVEMLTGPSRSVHIDVLLPQELVEQIDRLARDRSDFLAEAVREKLGTA